MEHLQQTMDLFYEKIGEIYSADDQLVGALLHMRDRTINTDLHQILMDLQKQKKTQCARLKDITKSLHTELLSKPCDAMKSLIQQALSTRSSSETAEENDLNLVAQLKNIQSYEISAYQAAIRIAQVLNLEDVSLALQQSLNDEESAAQKVTAFAKL
jgi:ferritin-like metal-binding protein YciE